VHDAFELGGVEAIKALRWGAGAPLKDKASVDELEWLVDQETLKQQAYMNLEQRAGAFNLKYSRALSARDISEIYRNQGVSL
jgi:hypothetical protein